MMTKRRWCGMFIFQHGGYITVWPNPLSVSYQVPKEVGKVGVESATFIQPITERKDGIQAMFAKQANASGSGSQPSTPSKGKKRDLDSSPEPQSKTESGNRSPNKKLKIEKLDAWEDSSEIELLDTPPQSQVCNMLFYWMTLFDVFLMI